MSRNGFTISLDDKELNRQLKNALRRNPTKTIKAIKDCTLDLAGNSAKIAPVDTGDLRNNCVADLNGVTIFENQSQKGVSIAPSLKAIGDIGYSLPYALRQHEELSYNHPKGGQAKYLEQPFEERKQRYIDRISKIVDEVIR